MAVNANWHRYVLATYVNSISIDAAAVSLPVVFDFGAPRTPSWEDAKTKAEVTISGPQTKQLSFGRWRVRTDVFVVVTSNLSNNNYDHVDAVGAMAAALDKCFEVKDYGDTGLLLIGLLKPVRDLAENIDVRHLRPTSEDTQLHSTLTARYEGRF